MRCQYCGELLKFEKGRGWVHANSQGEYYFHCEGCGFYATSKRYLSTCPTCGEALKVHLYIAYPVPEEETKEKT